MNSVRPVDNPVEIAQTANLSLPNHNVRLSQFLWLSVQLGLVLAVALLYRLELDRGFGTVGAVAFVGFLIHSWLPIRIRTPFFVSLCVVALVAILQWDALWVIVLGLTLLALCHVPVSWTWRVFALLAMGLLLAAVRVGWFELRWSATVLPVLGAMFMFRMFLYVYDLKSENSPATLSQRLAYFFMLPNACFPLFPVVDYKTFLKSY